MVTYKLIAETIFDDKRIILEEKRLLTLDKFIYRNFDSIDALAHYFDVPAIDFEINYTYAKVLRSMDIILRDKNANFDHLLATSQDNKIDTASLSFWKIMKAFYEIIDDKKLRTLYDNNYISKKNYNDISSYLNMSPNSYDYRGDRKEIYIEIKRNLSYYIDFRKFYSGLKFLNSPKPKTDSEFPKRVAKTENDLLNSFFNTGGLDMVYSTFDLDEINTIDGSDTLGIDGLCYTKKK